jgi:hypothetical protein
VFQWRGTDGVDAPPTASHARVVVLGTTWGGVHE